MGGGRTTRAIKSSTIRSIRTAQTNLEARTQRLSPTPQTIPTDGRTRAGARAAQTLREVRIAEEAVGLTKDRGRARDKDKDRVVTAKVGGAKETGVDGVEGANAVRKAAAIARAATARMMAATTRSS